MSKHFRGVAEEEGPAVASEEERQGHVGRDLFMVFLALVSIAILVYDETFSVPADERQALIIIDGIIVVLFALEFAIGIWQAQDKKAYWKSHWWELPGLVPMAAGNVSFLRVFRLVRIARVFRIFRVISVIARLRRANRVAKGFLARSHVAALIAAGATLILACSYLEFLFEKDSPTGHFKTFWDALWWGIVTTTTVGYGDKFPVTVGGKIVAIVLMLTGIGTIGLLAGSLANAFIKAPSSAPPGAPKRLEDRLGQLAALHAEGNLTDEEFRAAKAKLLGES